ncbi:hypothetical protein ACFLZP_03370 [Patescibacteria group bacterium]
MAEEVGVDEHRLYEWLPKEELDREREIFIEKNKGQFSNFFQTNEHFADLNPELKDTGAELVTRFFFGVHMAYRRFGFKHPIYKITYDTGERSDYDGIAFHDESNEYVAKVKFLKRVLEITKEKGQCLIEGAGIKEMIPAGDFFEIGGIEEAAHLMFYNEKGHLGEKPVAEADEEYKYYTSEMESRALKWKLAYVRRYMPQYYDSLKQTSEKVREIRLGST